MNIIPTAIPEVVLLEPCVFGDARGYFYERFSQQRFDELVAPTQFVQDNESKSSRGVLRGLHFQKGAMAQAKLVSVVKGEVLDVAVDLRADSPTFGQHVAQLLTEENKRQMFVPRGFAHGFVVLSETAIFQYKCDNYYSPADEGSLYFNDPALGIDWRLPADQLLLSDKDKIAPMLKDAYRF